MRVTSTFEGLQQGPVTRIREGSQHVYIEASVILPIFKLQSAEQSDLGSFRFLVIVVFCQIKDLAPPPWTMFRGAGAPMTFL